MRPIADDAAHPLTIHPTLGEPRGRLLTSLCGCPQTAVELAERVGTSSNAVRVHLEGLRDAGLVGYEVARRGVGKPTHVYSLTPAAEYLLSAAYLPTLQLLVAALRDRLNGGFVPLLRDVGKSLAETIATKPDKRGIESAVRALSALGTPATLETDGATQVVRNSCCPLAAVARQTPEICQLMEQLLTTASGVQMRERCERGVHPHCAFSPASETTTKRAKRRR
jgi:predicted ArsR family transcriptional regulator